MFTLKRYLLIVLLLINYPTYSEQIRFITEDYPPYNYLQDGELKGLSVEIIKEMMKQTPYDYQIEVLPWARAMVTVERNKNSFIFSMRRIPSRIMRYVWIGVLTSSPQAIYALHHRDDIEINNLDDLHHYKIGTTVNDSRDTVLVNHGIPKINLTRLSGQDAYERNYGKLKEGRIDVWPMDGVVAFYIVKKQGDDPRKQLKKVYSFDSGKNAPYYLATNLKSDPKVVATIREALQNFKETPEYLSILNRWGGSP